MTVQKNPRNGKGNDYEQKSMPKAVKWIFSDNNSLLQEMADSIMVLSERREADRCSEFHIKKSIAQIQTEFGQLIISQYNFQDS